MKHLAEAQPLWNLIIRKTEYSSIYIDDITLMLDPMTIIALKKCIPQILDQ